MSIRHIFSTTSTNRFSFTFFEHALSSTIAYLLHIIYLVSQIIFVRWCTSPTKSTTSSSKRTVPLTGRRRTMQTQTFAKLCSPELCSLDSHSFSAKSQSSLIAARRQLTSRVPKSLRDPFDGYPHPRIVPLSRLINFAVFPLSALC